MIKLSRVPAPQYLTPSKVLELTNLYAQTGKSVWGHGSIKKSLLQMSHGKCAYCECLLTEESKYMEVEHFECKKNYPEKVVHWDNLLPSCKRCNGAKADHNVNDDPIVNPVVDDPRAHFSFFCYRFKHKTVLGSTTLEVVDLNDYDRVVMKRFEVGSQIGRVLEDIKRRCDEYAENASVRARNRIIGPLRAILNECQPSASYAATAATVLHLDSTYFGIREFMLEANLWSEEIQILHDASINISFDI